MTFTGTLPFGLLGALLALAILVLSGRALANPEPAEADAQLLSPRLQQWRDAGQFASYKGLKVYYQTLGQGPALLLLHGYPYNSYDFKWVAEQLAQKYRVIMFDLPGMGFSDKPQEHRYSFAEYADVTNTILAQLGIDQVDILAHDLGVSIAQELLAQADANRFGIRSIAFMNGGLFTDVYRPRLIQRLLSQSPSWFGSFLSQRIGRASIERSVLTVFGEHTKPSQELLDDYWEILNHRDGKSIIYLLGQLVFEKEQHQQRWIGAMQGTHTPLAYICGPADPNSGRHMAQRYRELLPDSPVFMLQDAIGHWPQIEAPEQVLAAYDAFRQKIAALPPANPLPSQADAGKTGAPD